VEGPPAEQKKARGYQVQRSDRTNVLYKGVKQGSRAGAGKGRRPYKNGKGKQREGNEIREEWREARRSLIQLLIKEPDQKDTRAQNHQKTPPKNGSMREFNSAD